MVDTTETQKMIFDIVAEFMRKSGGSTERAERIIECAIQTPETPEVSTEENTPVDTPDALLFDAANYLGAREAKALLIARAIVAEARKHRSKIMAAKGHGYLVGTALDFTPGSKIILGPLNPSLLKALGPFQKSV